MAVTLAMQASAFSTKRPADPSFRQFAKANGIDMSQLFRSRETKGLEPHCARNARRPGAAGAALVGCAGGGESGGVWLPGGAGGGAGSGVNPAVSGCRVVVVVRCRWGESGGVWLVRWLVVVPGWGEILRCRVALVVVVPAG